MTMSTSLSWRAAHHWLRGYSDALAAREYDAPNPIHAGFEDDYDRGFTVGQHRLEVRA